MVTGIDNTHSLPVPASPAEVTADWLQQALAPFFPGVLIEAVTADRLGEGYGLASRIYRYYWGTSALPRSVVVKLWRTDGPGGTREVQFYRAFGQAIDARMRCSSASWRPNPSLISGWQALTRPCCTPTFIWTIWSL